MTSSESCDLLIIDKESNDNSIDKKTIEKLNNEMRNIKTLDFIFNIDSRDSTPKENIRLVPILKKNQHNRNGNGEDSFSINSYSPYTNTVRNSVDNSPKIKFVNFAVNNKEPQRLSLKKNKILENPQLNNDIISKQSQIKEMKNFTDFLKNSAYDIKYEDKTEKKNEGNYMVNFIVNVQNFKIDNRKKINFIENHNYLKTQFHTEQNFITSPNFKSTRSVKPKERFRVLFIKLQIVLLFKYILKCIKYYGVNMLSVDLQKEMIHIDKLNLDCVVKTKKISKIYTESMFTIHPGSKFVSAWSYITLSLLAYTCSILPYNVCFGDGATIFSTLFFIEVICDILFILDLFFNFFIGYYDEDKDKLIMSNKEIACNYMKGWFIIDLVSTFPFNYLEYLGNGDPSQRNKSLNKLIRLTKLPRLYKLIKLFKLLRFLKFLKKNALFAYLAKLIKINNGFKRILKAYFLMLILCHLFACIYHFSAKFNDYELNTWVFRYNLTETENYLKYIIAFYNSLVAISGAGFGDYVPYTLSEKIITLFIFFNGIAFYSFTIANLSIVISNLHDETANLHLKMNTLNNFCSKVNVNNDTYIKMTKVFEDNLHDYFSYDQDKFFQEIPFKLRMELLFQLNEKIIRSIKFFADKTPSFVCEILGKWKRIDFPKKTYIYFEGDLPYDIFIVKKGTVVYLDTEGNQLNRLIKGSLIGEIEPFLSVFYFLILVR